MTPFKDISNIRFGKLIALEPTPERINSARVWLCICDCGNMHKTSIKGLMAGTCRSCGCGERANRIANMRKAADGRKKAPGESNFNTLFSSYKDSAISRGYEFRLTKDQFREITSMNCDYCGKIPRQYFKSHKSNGAYICNGIDRVDNGIGYIYENCVPCCEDCNRGKMKKTKEEFLAWVDRIYKHQHGED